MPDSHAKYFSPSSAARWLNCTASVALQEKFPAVETDYAAEGTEAHALCEYTLKTALGHECEPPTFAKDERTGEPKYLTREMTECAENYTAFVLEHIKDENSVTLVEQRIDFSVYAPGGFGTADCIILNGDEIQVIDFKYGKGVAVDAAENPQMMLYAIGACEIFAALYDIRTVTMSIFQPRLANISSYTISAAKLYDWADTKVRSAVKAIETGATVFKCGAHCKFCKAKAVCEERAKQNLKLAEYDFAEPGLLTEEAVTDILGRLAEFKSWASDIEDYALKTAISGKKWTGWKLVEGRSIRKYSDEQTVIKRVADAGFDPYTHTVRGITEMTALLGRKKFSELLGDCLVKPQGKPTLVPETDKRPEMRGDFDD